MNKKDLRLFLNEVDKLAKLYNADYFIVTNGGSKYSNRGEGAIEHARRCHEDWEREHGFDPTEDWALAEAQKMFIADIRQSKNIPKDNIIKEVKI